MPIWKRIILYRNESLNLQIQNARLGFHERGVTGTLGPRPPFGYAPVLLYVYISTTQTA